MVTWNPQLMEVKAEPGATLVYELQQDPRRDHRYAGGEHRTLKDNPDLGKALVGIWYETIAR